MRFVATLIALFALGVGSAEARTSGKEIESIQRSTEMQIRNLLEPVIEKYCRDECKIMAVSATVDLADSEELAPGFDEMDSTSAPRLEPSSAQVKLLMDEKVGPITRRKLMDFVQQYLDTLDFPVKVITQAVNFPQPVGSAAKVAELKERISKQFKNAVEGVFAQFCPRQCVLGELAVQVDPVNVEEAQYGAVGEYVEDNGVAVRVSSVTGTLLMDASLPQEERNNILEMARLKTGYLRNVELASKEMKFPKPIMSEDGTVIGSEYGPGGKSRSLASDSKSSSQAETSEKKTSQSSEKSDTRSTADNKATTTETNAVNENKNETRQERFERIEKIERVESGDAVQAELQKFKVFGLIFACSVISLLIFIALAIFKPRSGKESVQRIIQTLTTDPTSNAAPSTYRAPSSDSASGGESSGASRLGKRYEIERLMEELMAIFAQQPKVAKYVFSRILTEEGVETTAKYIQLFGESVVMDMLRDPSLQSDLNELMEFYAKNPIEIEDGEKVELLRKLHNRTVAGKMVVMGSRSSNLFDFLVEMDGTQILELVRNESMTVKAIVLTQTDAQKRAAIYAHLEEDVRMKLLTELSRIDYLPRDYIANVANALKRKRKENPKLNTEALPGSEVLISLLERTGPEMQKQVLRMLESSAPESARSVKNKLVSVDTLLHLRDSHLLEVILSLKHEELLQFLKGTIQEARDVIFRKAPKDLVLELEEELANFPAVSREGYQAVERKVLNRMKLMAADGIVNLVEVNERMLSGKAPMQVAPSATAEEKTQTMSNVKKVAGW